MKKTYFCEACLYMHGTELCTGDGQPVEDAVTYFDQRKAMGDTVGFFLDESDNDMDHEAAIGLIRHYTQKGLLPVMAGGRSLRLEDVKKYIYAGAKAALLRENTEAEMALYQDAVSRFGVNRVALYREGAPGCVTAEESEIDLSWSQFKTGADGLLPCIVQDFYTGQVLMMAYMNEEAFQKTCETGRMTYFSRSRGKLWLKGETSGHYQYVKKLQGDCDRDTLLAQVEQIGVACHTGSYSCFFRPLIEAKEKKEGTAAVFENLEQVIAQRKIQPKEGSYTNYLFEKGLDKILKKLGEEAVEIIIAAKNPDPEEIKYESADFLYHLMVLLAEKGVAWQDIVEELAKR